jgi:hypothetical protein
MDFDLGLIEGEALDGLIVGLKHPALAGNSILAALYLVLSEEWFRRQAGEQGGDVIELPIREANNLEVKEAVGFFYGLVCSLKLPDYLQGFKLCWSLLATVNEEANRRMVECIAVKN